MPRTKDELRTNCKWVKVCIFIFLTVVFFLCLGYQFPYFGLVLVLDIILYIATLIIPDKILWDMENRINHEEPVQAPRMSIDDAEAGLRWANEHYKQQHTT